jgi:hypothetical protein
MSRSSALPWSRRGRQRRLQLGCGARRPLSGQELDGVVAGHQVQLQRIAGLPVRGDLQDRRPADAAMGDQHGIAKGLSIAARLDR